MDRNRIGIVADEAGVAASTIRYYERIGLLPQPERKSGRRRYGASILAQLRLIRSAQEAGFTLGEIQILLHGFPSGTPPSERWRSMSKGKIASIERKITVLLEMKAVLENTLRCHCATLEECASNCGSGTKPSASLCCTSLPSTSRAQ